MDELAGQAKGVSLLAASSLAPYPVESLRETAFLLKRCGLRRDLALEQVAAQVQEGEDTIGH